MGDTFTCVCRSQHFVELQRFERNGCLAPTNENHLRTCYCPSCSRIWVYLVEQGWRCYGMIQFPEHLTPHEKDH